MLPDRGIPPRYDYSQAGFGPFLTRSIDHMDQANLSSPGGAMSRAVAFDRQQVTGTIGDIIQVGRVQINGDGYISITDEEGNEVTRIGDLEA